MNEQRDMFSIININNKNPDSDIPKDVKLRPKELWCPYCSKPVIFIKDKELGVRKCPYCKVSDRDYNVKKINKKWL
ncbi:hypothetical protein KQI41_11370 [Tissierella pigra]|uniref:Uncharacterized protein n=1 Tax=Tissierella pigra TaxID=2607614 RepID=A0A6N7Y2W2_9FIRM|nr:hypothetical protein [Tissierella pigra]MBU5427013.1 hypothetical protein [Tissierella pigra]MSU02390.1 hypothetical protein [Tissierella pigra]